MVECVERGSDIHPAVERSTVRIDVSVVAPRGCHLLAMDLFIRREPSAESPLLWVCVPGGGNNRRYFDLEVTGEGSAFSMARTLAASGDLVVTVDPPGVGESDTPDDAYALSPTVVSDVLAAAIETLRTDLGRRGGLGSGAFSSITPRAVVGLGHSAGALLVACQQARHRSYDMTALLGFSASGLPEVLSDEELQYAGRPVEFGQALVELTRVRFGDPLPDWSNRDLGERRSDTLATAVDAALAQASSRLLALVGMTAIVPGSVQPELDKIQVPVFAALGEHDLAGTLDVLPAQLPACGDLTLFLLEDAGHNHNVAKNRQALWSRLMRWADSVAVTRPNSFAR